MSDFKDLLEKTLETIDNENGRLFNKEFTLDCGHVVNGLTKSLILSGKKVGLELYSSVTVCPPCAYKIHDTEHPEHYTVKNLVRKRKSL